MKIGDKVFVKIIIDKKIETYDGVFWEAHIDQYKKSGNMLSSVHFNIIENLNEIKEIL